MEFYPPMEFAKLIHGEDGDQCSDHCEEDQSRSMERCLSYEENGFHRGDELCYDITQKRPEVYERDVKSFTKTLVLSGFGEIVM